MNKNERIKIFTALGHKLRQFISHPDDILLSQIENENPWFIREFVLHALDGISIMLDEKKLYKWLEHYELKQGAGISVGIVMPGNIPLAGFHDFMCVLLSGNKALIKPSHSDRILIQYIAGILNDPVNEFSEMVDLSGDYGKAEAMIATGSDNTARYFEYSFRNKPAVIRRNRSSCAILNGKESESELKSLADDIFMYFGLGCRNVAKLFVPDGYEIETLMPYLSGYEWIKTHRKYFNNYRYRKGLARAAGNPSIDMGFFHFEHSRKFVSPISVIYYEKYRSEAELNSLIRMSSEKIQCTVTSGSVGLNKVKFGAAQFPGPSDYADNIDTLAFLENLSRQ